MALSRKSKIIIGAVAAVLVVAVIVISIFATRTDTPEVTVVKAEKRPELRSTVTSSGEVRPIQFQNLTSEVQGRIEDIYVKEGDLVKKGQPLVKLDPNQLQSSTDAQLAALQSAQDDVRVDKSQVEFNAATRELKRNQQLLESGVVSRQAYDESKDRLDSATAALNTARANLAARQLGIKDAQARLNGQTVAVTDARRGVNTANLSVSSSQARATQQSAQLRGEK